MDHLTNFDFSDDYSEPSLLRKYLVKRHLVFPVSPAEKAWLVDSVRERLRSAMGALSSFKDDLDSMPSDYIEEAYPWGVDFKSYEVEICYWKGVLLNLYLSFGFEDCFDDEDCRDMEFALRGAPHVGFRDLYVRQMISSATDLLVNGEGKLSELVGRLAEVERKLAEFKAADRCFDNVAGVEEDEDELSDEFNFYASYAESLRAGVAELGSVLPLVWECLVDLHAIPRVASCMNPQLCSLIAQGAKEEVISRIRDGGLVPLAEPIFHLDLKSLGLLPGMPFKGEIHFQVNGGGASNQIGESEVLVTYSSSDALVKLRGGDFKSMDEAATFSVAMAKKHKVTTGLRHQSGYWEVLIPLKLAVEMNHFEGRTSLSDIDDDIPF